MAQHPGAGRLLADLRERDVKVGAVTSKTRERMTCDEQVCGLSDSFDVVITGDDVTRGKPEPEGVVAALRALGVAPADAWMVGDGPVDVRAGRAAGVRTIGITHGLHSSAELEEAGPDHLVTDLAEVAELLLR